MQDVKWIKIGNFKYPAVYSIAAAKAIAQKQTEKGKLTERLDNVAEDNASIAEIGETYMQMLEILIMQGCRYKNLVDKGTPIEKGALVDENGEYIPIGVDEMELIFGLNDIGYIVDEVLKVMSLKDREEKNEIATPRG